MVKIDSLFKKKSNKDPRGNLSQFKQSLSRGMNGQLSAEDELNSRQIREEVAELMTMFPGSPDFLGRAEYTVRRNPLGFISRKYPDISDLRDLVNRFANKTEITDPRIKIRKLLKRYPAYPDLRALNAIQIFNDSSQSGLDAKKIKVLQGALREITRALYNGGLSVFNINWFIKIYVRYLDLLKDRLQHEHNAIRNHFSNDIKSIAEDVHYKHLQLTVMSAVKTKLSGLALLNAKLKGSIYTVANISHEEITKACIAIKNEDGSRRIGDGGKTANNVIYIIMTINLLFARIPIMDNLVKQYQRLIPDINRDVILQKVMVNNMRRVTEFQLSMASGDKSRTHDIAKKMYLDCIEIIKQHLDRGILTKQHEIDPIIKTAWIVKESKGLFPDDQYKVQLENALKLLEVVFSKRVQVKGAYDLARNLQDDLQFIMIEYGWMK